MLPTDFDVPIARRRVRTRRWNSAFVFHLLPIAFATVQARRNEATTVRLRNDSGVPFDLGWVNPNDQSVTAMTTIGPSEIFQMQSFRSHRFEILELPSNDSGRCELGASDSPWAADMNLNFESVDCLTGYFVVTETPEQHFVVNRLFQILRDDSMASIDEFQVREPSEVLSMCRFDAKKRLLRADVDELETQQILDDMQECLLKGISPKLKEVNDEIDFEAKIRTEVSNYMENYTCTNGLQESSPDIDEHVWTSPRDKVKRKVHVKLNRQASKIHVVEDFASLEECEAMEISVEGKLDTAVTNDGQGGVQVSQHRKALQADVDPDWLKEKQGDPITRLSRRIYDYTEHVLGLNITEHGQEPLMSIQYFGRGTNDTEPDRYQPHCDGKCEGDPFIHASRVATFVVYCQIPESGGHTNFQNANVIVKPQIGSGVFFTYIDPSTKLTDTGFSRHSGCPVFEGEKKIVTQWIRFGVDLETTHAAYNSLEVLISEDGE